MIYVIKQLRFDLPPSLQRHARQLRPPRRVKQMRRSGHLRAALTCCPRFSMLHIFASGLPLLELKTGMRGNK